MTTVSSRTPRGGHGPDPTAAMPPGRWSPGLFGGSRYGSTSLRVGRRPLWLSVIVLLPLAAILWQAAGGGWKAFWSAVTSHAAIESFKVTLTVSLGVTVLNVFFGLLVAWVLTRDDFPGKRLVDSVIDLPFALPTIVASLVMLALYGPNSPIDLHLQHTKWGIGVALLFVTLPFVVRSVQPVLLELDREIRGSGGVAGRQQLHHLHVSHSSGVAACAAVRCGPGVLPSNRRVRFGGADRWRGAW